MRTRCARSRLINSPNMAWSPGPRIADALACTTSRRMVDRANCRAVPRARGRGCGSEKRVGRSAVLAVYGRSRRPELRTLLDDYSSLRRLTPTHTTHQASFARPQACPSVSRPQAQCTESAVIMRCAVRPAMPDAPPRCFQLRRQSWRAAAAAGALIVGHRGSRARLCVVVVRGSRALIVSHRGGWREGGRRARTA